jgi:hypothetical protein
VTPLVFDFFRNPVPSLASLGQIYVDEVRDRNDLAIIVRAALRDCAQGMAASQVRAADES